MNIYDAKLRDIIGGTFDEDNEEEARTTAFLPLWLRKVFADIHEEFDLPLYKVISRTIRLGASIFEHKYRGKIKEIKELWTKLRWTDNTWIDSLPDYHFSVNNMSGAKRKFVKMPLWCDNMLGGAAMELNTEKSAAIRISMYLAIDTWDGLNKKVEKQLKQELAKFDKQINDILLALRVLATVDSRIKGEETK